MPSTDVAEAAKLVRGKHVIGSVNVGNVICVHLNLTLQAIVVSYHSLVTGVNTEIGGLQAVGVLADAMNENQSLTALLPSQYLNW